MSVATSAGSRVRRVYYGWWVALTGAFDMLVSSGPTFQASSVLFRAIEDEFHWSRGAVAGVASFGRFGGAMFGPAEGWLTDRFGSSRMVLVGFAFGGVGLILFSRTNSLFTYYLSFIILSIGFSIGGFTPSMAAVNSWMPHRRAAAMSLVLAGSSIGGLLVPAIVWGIHALGWRDTVMVIGVITIAAGPPIAFVFSRRAPDQPPDSVQRRPTVPGNRFASQRDFTVSEALRTRAFWSLTLTHTMLNLSVSAVSAHIFLHLTDPVGVNLSDDSASSIVPVMAGAAFVCQLLGGFLGDRVYKPVAVSILALVQGSSILLLAFSDQYWMALAFAFAWGLGFGGRTPLLHAMRGEFFGRRNYGKILGLSAFPMAIGMTVTPWVVGRLFDLQGTYRYAFITLAALSLISSVAILFAQKPIVPGGAGKLNEPA